MNFEATVEKQAFRFFLVWLCLYYVFSFGPFSVFIGDATRYGVESFRF